VALPLQSIYHICQFSLIRCLSKFQYQILHSSHNRCIHHNPRNHHSNRNRNRNHSHNIHRKSIYHNIQEYNTIQVYSCKFQNHIMPNTFHNNRDDHIH